MCIRDSINAEYGWINKKSVMRWLVIVVVLALFRTGDSTCIAPVTFSGEPSFSMSSSCLIPPGQKIPDSFLAGCGKATDPRKLTLPFISGEYPTCSEERDLCELALKSLDCSVSCPKCSENSSPGIGVGEWTTLLAQNFEPVGPPIWPDEAAFPCRFMFDAVFEHCCPATCDPELPHFNVIGTTFAKLLEVYDRIGEREECTANAANPTLTQRISTSQRPYFALALRPTGFSISVGEQQDDNIVSDIQYPNHFKNRKATSFRVLPLVPSNDGQSKVIVHFKVPNYLYTQNVGHVSVRVQFRSVGLDFQTWIFMLYNYRTEKYEKIGTQKSTRNTPCVVTVGGPPAANDCKWDIFTLDTPKQPSDYISTEDTPRRMKLMIKTGFGAANPTNPSAELDYVTIDLIPNQRWVSAWPEDIYEDDMTLYENTAKRNVLRKDLFVNKTVSLRDTIPGNMCSDFA
eukprot:TRINITY_DN6352_c0_g1_i1.p1 TRINITY_DN6352_c0_g1~~TRINITY_DN6352_c0_g1_i1.p1  ORF type:complete len:458 (+),score=42.02 TRINITY_DN6352_c0_g1_i1:46-1419(+)